MSRRILLITDIFPPDIGGPASFIADLAAHLAQEGRTVTVFCTSVAASDPGDAGRPYEIKRVRRQSGYLGALIVFASLILTVMRHKLIFCNGLEMHTYRACRLLGRSYILKIVGDLAWEYARNTNLTSLSIDEFQQGPHSGRTAKMVRQRNLFTRTAQTIITPSHYLAGLVEGWGCDPARVQVVYNGIELGHYANIQVQHRQQTDLQLLYVGRLVNWKGISYLLEAIASLDGVHLTVLGDGPQRDHLEAQAIQANLPVHFEGSVSREGVRQTMVKSDVLILVSSYEGLSHTLIEGCASGLPAITSDRGGNPEVIEEGVQGIVVAYGDIEALRSAITTLRDDEETRYRLALAAKKHSTRFDFAQTLASTLEIIERT